MERTVYKAEIADTWREEGFAIRLREGLATGISHGDGRELIRQYGDFYTPADGRWHDSREQAMAEAVQTLRDRVIKLREQIDAARTAMLNDEVKA